MIWGSTGICKIKNEVNKKSNTTAGGESDYAAVLTVEYSSPKRTKGTWTEWVDAVREPPPLES